MKNYIILKVMEVLTGIKSVEDISNIEICDNEGNIIEGFWSSALAFRPTYQANIKINGEVYSGIMDAYTDHEFIVFADKGGTKRFVLERTTCTVKDHVRYYVDGQWYFREGGDIF